MQETSDIDHDSNSKLLSHSIKSARNSKGFYDYEFPIRDIYNAFYVAIVKDFKVVPMMCFALLSFGLQLVGLAGVWKRSDDMHL